MSRKVRKIDSEVLAVANDKIREKKRELSYK
jgi:hypothetical protein